MDAVNSNYEQQLYNEPPLFFPTVPARTTRPAKAAEGYSVAPSLRGSEATEAIWCGYMLKERRE
ncbi:MAG: hypothetical protein ABI836_02610 [Gemmatimonadota bacterium]